MNKNSSQSLQNENNKKSGKLLDRFKIRVSDLEFTIEIYNHDISDDFLKTYSVLVNGKEYTVEVEPLELGPKDRQRSQDSIPTPTRPAKAPTQPTEKSTVPPPEPIVAAEPKAAIATPTATSVDITKVLSAPMPGKILDIKTKIGDKVESGQPLVILEAMKMENVMTAPTSGVVKAIPISVGVNVSQGDDLVIIE